MQYFLLENWELILKPKFKMVNREEVVNREKLKILKDLSYICMLFLTYIIAFTVHYYNSCTL